MKRGWQDPNSNQQRTNNFQRSPPSSSKRRRKLSYDRSEKPKKNGETILDGQVVPKLDQSNPEHSRRIQQRRRMIMFGKNTVGYDEYIKRIPKEKRKPRCPEQPSTPDHTIEIPTRRWQGLIKAWRKTLHKYDPPDLDNNKEKSGQKEAKRSMPSRNIADDKKPAAKIKQSVQEKQIAEATSKGLLVQFAPDASLSNDVAGPAVSPIFGENKGISSTNKISSAVSPSVSTGTVDADALDEEEETYQRLIQQTEEEGTDSVARWGPASGRHNEFLEDDSDDDLL